MSLVLVAGGAGFLGAAISRALLEAGDSVLLLDRFDDSGDGRAAKEERAALLGAHPRTVFVRADATDRAALEETFATHRPAAVVALVSAEALLDVGRASGVGFFLRVSDGALYGDAPAPGALATEDEPLAPGGDAALEALAADEARVLAAGVPSALLRVFDLLADDPASTRFPADALAALRAGEEVFVDDDRPRDYLPLSFAARAVASALRTRPAGRTLNVASGAALRPSEVISALGRAIGRSPRLVILPSPPGRREPRIASLERARRQLDLGERPPVDDLAADLVAGRPPDRPATPGAFPAVSPAAPRRPTASAAEPPPAVSRRELFGLFRKPFGKG